MPEWLKSGLRWTLRIAIFGFAAAGILYVVGALGGPSKSVEIEKDTVASDWNDAVHKRNIEPIYPPQEDVYVGDIYATISGGGPNFLGRSMKLWHLNLNAAIQRAYQDLPIFPTTSPVPEKEGQVWQQEAADFLFSPAQRKSLSLVAFPSFVVRHARSASAGAGSGIWNSRCDSRQRRDGRVAVSTCRNLRDQCNRSHSRVNRLLRSGAQQTDLFRYRRPADALNGRW
jgi:hypothetical protein